MCVNVYLVFIVEISDFSVTFNFSSQVEAPCSSDSDALWLAGRTAAVSSNWNRGWAFLLHCNRGNKGSRVQILLRFRKASCSEPCCRIQTSRSSFSAPHQVFLSSFLLLRRLASPLSVSEAGGGWLLWVGVRLPCRAGGGWLGIRLLCS